jgi:hypothetical protein
LNQIARAGAYRLGFAKVSVVSRKYFGFFMD